MSVLILFLSATCCSDENAITKESNIKITKQESETNNPFNDSCSPFCQCQCCAGFSINHQQAVLPEVVAAVNNKCSAYLVLPIVEISKAVWQPPQINS